MELVHEDAAESHRRRKNADLKASVYKSLENSKASLSSNDDNAVMQNYQDKQMIIPISHWEVSYATVAVLIILWYN